MRMNSFMRTFFNCGLAFSIISLTLITVLGGCSAGTTKGRPLTELSETETSGGKYIVSGGDNLSVQVWGEPKLSGEVFVRDDGNLTMPLINDVPAAGRTLDAISTDITARLKDFVPSASVSISVVQSAPIRYFLSGAFAKPGEFRSEGKITLLQAIATGGGFAPFANEGALILIRKTAEGELRYKLDYNRVISGSEPNPMLKNGDVVAVQ